MVSEDRQAKDVSSAESQKRRATHDYGNCLAPMIKLPAIEIPKFGGQITEFKHFHDTFNSLIIKALDLSIPLHEVLLSQILIEHVDEVTRRKLGNEGSFPRNHRA